MKIYIDESGDFDLKNTSKTSLIVAIIVPENREYKLIKFFEKLYKRALTHEKDANGEIKGYLMDEDNIKFVYSFLEANKDVRIVAHVFDSGMNTPDDIRWHREEQAKRFVKGKEHYLTGPVKAKSVTDFIDEKERWTKRRDLISDELFIQLILQVNVIREALHKILVHYHADCYRGKCFESVDVIIDRKNKKIKKPEKFILDVLYGFLETKWAERENYIVIDSLCKNNHPFLKFNIKDGNVICTDLKKLFGKGIVFEDSKEHIGLQLADIIASSLRRIILGKVDKKMFDQIRTNGAYFRKNWQAVTICTFRKKRTIQNKDRNDIYKFIQSPGKILI